MANKKIMMIISAVIIIGFFFFYLTSPKTEANVVLNSENEVTVFKSINCVCCSNYISYLKKQGLKVYVVNTEDNSPIKRDYQIPGNMESCHTTLIGDYFVEGHIPIDAIIKLMEDMPMIDGIALPDMPSGSPGMPGAKREKFVIYAITDGISSEFMIM